MKTSQRLKPYPPLAMTLAAYAMLGLIWFAIWQQFLGAMLPRLQHIPAAGLHLQDRPCGSPECDFSVFWPAGLLARLGRFDDIYNPASFLLWRQHYFMPRIDALNWFYPPMALLPFLALSRLPFEIAFAVWTVAFTVAAIVVLRLAALSWLVILTALLSPAALWNLELGQFGTITGAILISGLLLADKSPCRGGGILGLLIVKPQPGLLVPIVLLAARNWRAILGAVFMAALLLGSATALLGLPVWQVYVSEGLKVSKIVLQAAPLGNGYEKFGVSTFWMLRSLGAGLPLSYGAQALATLFAAGLAWQICRNKAVSRIERLALTVFLSLLATPYGYTDDMVAWSIALAALAEQRGWRIDWLDALFWLWPALCPIVFMKTGFLLTPLIIFIAVMRSLRVSGLSLPLWPFKEVVLPRAG